MGVSQHGMTEIIGTEEDVVPHSSPIGIPSGDERDLWRSSRNHSGPKYAFVAKTKGFTSSCIDNTKLRFKVSIVPAGRIQRGKVYDRPMLRRNIRHSLIDNISGQVLIVSFVLSLF